MRIVIHIAKEALAELQQSQPALLALIAMPAALLIATEVAKLFVSPSIAQLLSVAAAMLWCVLAIRVHRFVLCREKESPRAFGAAVVIRFFLAALLAGLAATLVFWVPFSMMKMDGSPSATPTLLVVLVLAVLISTYLLARLSLLLPDRALGRREPIASVWGWSQGKAWKLTAALFVPALALELLITLISYPLPSPADELLVSVLSVPLAVFQVTLLSVAYRGLRPKGLDKEGAGSG